jgi:hypothetical protein
MTLGIARRDNDGTMNATRLIEEWKRQGRVLEVALGIARDALVEALEKARPIRRNAKTV